MQVSHYPQNLPNNANMVYPQLIEAIKSTDTLVEGSMDSDVALIWSVLWSGKMSENKKVWDHYRNQGKPVIVIEVGGLVRNKTWKLGINGVNRDADFAVETVALAKALMLQQTGAAMVAQAQAVPELVLSLIR